MSRKWLAIVAKTAISLLLIWYLLERVDLAQVAERARRLDFDEALLCLLVLIVQTGLVAIRWWMVSRLLEIVLGLKAALRILLIGMFFNQTLPSSVGGDAVRVWLVSREGASLGKAVNVVLCDRVFASVVLVGLIGVSLPVIYLRIPDEATRSALTALVGVGAAGLAVFFLMGSRLARLLQRWKMTRPFGHLATDFRQLFTRVWPLTGLVGLSAGIHILTVAVVMLLGRGLNLPITFLDSLIVVPTVILLTTLPISVAGWGVRESAMVAGFGFLGVTAEGALTLSVLFGITQIVVALPGGLAWLAGRRTGGTPSP